MSDDTIDLKSDRLIHADENDYNSSILISYLDCSLSCQSYAVNRYKK